MEFSYTTLLNQGACGEISDGLIVAPCVLRQVRRRHCAGALPLRRHGEKRVELRLAALIRREVKEVHIAV